MQKSQRKIFKHELITVAKGEIMADNMIPDKIPENIFGKKDSKKVLSDSPIVLSNNPSLVNCDADTAQNNTQEIKDVNSVCSDCLKWESYGDKCWVHWKGKKECTQKARNSDEWQDEQKFRQF